VTPGAGNRTLEPQPNYPLNCWYVAATSDEVGQRLLARTLLGLPVVLYRLESGRVVALEDRCPHRSLPLSLGSLSGDEVVCGYHGMAFGSDGRCIRVPSQQNVPYGARVESFPVRDEPPFVWIWLGDPRQSMASDPPALPWLRDPAWTTFGETMQVDANYMLLHENALDLTHFPYVHPETSPTGYLTTPPQLEVELSETSVSYYRDFPPAALVGWQAETTGLPQDREYGQRESGAFVSPALHVDRMHVFTSGEGARSYDKVLTRAFTPLTPDTTTVFWHVSRNYLTDEPRVSDQLLAVHRRTLHADKRLLEAIQARAAAFPGGDEINVTADTAALKAHRIVTVMLAQERGRSAVRPGVPLTA
jgi:phenylpropionate dioxygenase-like ring-hydroxylating dioxygenase large terminal subunit